MMTRGSANSSYRQIQTLFARGTLAAHSDASLIALFLDRDGGDAEDAFAVLVRRHGPMVLGVCRKILHGSHEAEDAFQAVFLVLARRARSIRHAEGLPAWLYGVAVRTAKEARRREARRGAREGGTMDESRVVASTEPDDDRLATLTDALDAMPEKFRRPIVLCDIEGLPRHDAARRLELREGTLSSRLARGRAMLRDRLQRKGVGPIAGSAAVVTSLPESLAEATTRMAIAYVSPGMAAGVVPSAIASLAEGVLTMMAVSKITMGIGALILTIGAAAGIGLAANSQAHPEARPEPVSRTTEPAKIARPDNWIGDKPIAEGVVVDEAGRPVAGVEVLAYPDTRYEAKGTTDQNGLFRFPIKHLSLPHTRLLAREPGGKRLGIFAYPDILNAHQEPSPVRIVIKPSREVAVRVVDSANLPVEDAEVEVVSGHAMIARSSTSREGTAVLAYPEDAKVTYILALRSAKGFNFAELGEIVHGDAQGVDGPDVPKTVTLVLNGARSAMIEAKDSDGRPVVGVSFFPLTLEVKGRASGLNISPSKAMCSATNAEGIASFDWLPPGEQEVNFWPASEEYAHRRAMLESGQSGPIPIQLARKGSIRGRVLKPDGSPAAGVRVEGRGASQVLTDTDWRFTRTDADGAYTLPLAPDEAYAISVEDDHWAARTRFRIIVNEGLATSGVDFRLERGTLIRGRLTRATDGQPVANETVSIFEYDGRPQFEGSGLTERARFKYGNFQSISTTRITHATTDAEGNYAIRVAPGRYSIRTPQPEPSMFNMKDLVVKDEPEIVRDFVIRSAK